MRTHAASAASSPATGSLPSQHRHAEVEDHVVVVVSDPLDPPDELVADALEPGLLAELANHRLGQRLAMLDPPTGHRPLPRRRTVTAADEQQPLVVDGDGADAHLRAHGSAGAPMRWCMTNSRGRKPRAFEEVLRAPVARQRVRVARRTPARGEPLRHGVPSSCSPTPTPRPPASTNRSLDDAEARTVAQVLRAAHRVAHRRVVDRADENVRARILDRGGQSVGEGRRSASRATKT